MKPKEHRLLRDAQKRLRATSHENYLGVMRELFRSYQGIDYVDTLAGYFRSKRYDLALAMADSLSKHQHLDATTHFVANQFAALIRKYPWDPKLVNTNPESVGKETFIRTELKCKRLNKKFSLYASLRSPNESLYFKAVNWIRYIIGDQPDLEKILDACDFGAGASVGVHGNATHLLRKIGACEWTVTPGAMTYAYWAVMRNEQFRDVLLESKGDNIACLDWDVSRKAFSRKTRVVTYNKLSFVPKTAKTHRVIAVEPLLNGFLQKGADVELRKMLLRAGIDLRDQSKNQEMAREGSANDSSEGFVTIDLSSASDSISKGLARHLLPPDWFDFLNSLRAVEYELDGVKHRYHKFCSMGNGFCFPLETLIFAACCVACDCGVPGVDFSIYGDDIIVRQKHAGKVLSLLKDMGFKANPEKTFISGPFRESCGADWFGGADVRPYTLDFALDSIEALYKWLNITRRSSRTEIFFQDARPFILGLVPDQFLFLRPYKGEADSGIDSVADEYLTCSHCTYRATPGRKRPAGWSWKVLRHKPVSDNWSTVVYRRDSVDMYALLRGARPENNTRAGAIGVEYTFRRKTKTTISVAGGCGATSTWLPS